MGVRTNRRFERITILLLVIIIIPAASSRLRADSGICGGQNFNLPFNDVMGSVFFCQIAEIYFQGITSGTTPTTYSPSNNVTRDQMAAFLSRTLDTSLKRGSSRTVLDELWTTSPHYDLDLGTTLLGNSLTLIRSDGLYVWVVGSVGNIYRVRASDGKLIDTWSAASPFAVLCAMGKTFVTGSLSPAGSLYMIDPTLSPGVATTVNSALGDAPLGIGFDGDKIWTANDGSLSIITPGGPIPWSATTVSGFGRLNAFAYDGTNMWVTEAGSPGFLRKLDSAGAVLQSVTVGNNPQLPIFDGKNIWVPNRNSNTLTVVRASTGEVLATLAGNGLSLPIAAAFDGERVLVTSLGNTISLWTATDLSPIGDFATGASTTPFGACSDGQYFWITLRGPDQLARF